MKKIYGCLLLALTGQAALAQKFVPQIKSGTEMGYTISLKDQAVAFSLTLSATRDSLKMKWHVEDYGSGNYVMSTKSLQSGIGMHLESPEPNANIELPETETLAFISKDAFKDITQKQEMEFGDVKYVLSKNQLSDIKIGNKQLDVIHAQAANGKTELWILNNPDFPLICKTKNGSEGVDLEIDYIK
ncbi:hypothetical protein BEL04_10525 [Mucilaginibacter sp. PPCGB 2223]|uniref:hypothetical protein n=1 Tax=Mucilaginibacter sp. PPCGB 2223 TaxID=1886027 RepID=UPI0008265A6E|nr:hypothetical protein [Mucilaginibacter sp. PPCGB 2223]OCX54652.1 hypothetical protein BEL04_10525 [Mucilaginibacter sp. PPCGB 2223]